MNFRVEQISLDLHFKLAGNMYADRNNTPITNPPHGLCQYVGEEIYNKTICVAIAAFVEDKPVATLLARNISDTKLYFSGQWTDINYRRMGAASTLRKWMREFWPKQYDQVLSYFLISSFIERVQSTRAKIVEYPGHSWFPIGSQSYPHEQTILGYTEF